MSTWSTFAKFPWVEMMAVLHQQQAAVEAVD
jgi:hypothetical protein